MIDLNLNPSRKDLRLFAVLQVLFFAIVSAWLWRRGTIAATTVPVIVGVSAVLALVGVLRPLWIRYVYLGWILAAYPIGWTVSHLVLAVIFYVVMTPIGVIIRVCGRDPIRRRFDPDCDSYWHRREPPSAGQRYFRQY